MTRSRLKPAELSLITLLSPVVPRGDAHRSVSVTCPERQRFSISHRVLAFKHGDRARQTQAGRSGQPGTGGRAAQPYVALNRCPAHLEG